MVGSSYPQGTQCLLVANYPADGISVVDCRMAKGVLVTAVNQVGCLGYIKVEGRRARLGFYRVEGDWRLYL